MATYEVFGRAGRLRGDDVRPTIDMVGYGGGVRSRDAEASPAMLALASGQGFRSRYSNASSSLHISVVGRALRGRHRAAGRYLDLSTKYHRALLKLLPHGQAWTRDLTSQLSRLLRAFAEELRRADDRAAVLVEEADPRTTTELLGDWERNAGLPTDCVAPTTIDGRRAALVARLTDRGGQRPADYIAIADALGYAVQVEEYQPFTCVSACNDLLVTGSWVFVVSFVTSSGADDALLECVLGNRIPLHLVPLFRYE